MSKFESFLPAKYRTVEPESVADVHREISLIREPREPGYYVNNADRLKWVAG